MTGPWVLIALAMTVDGSTVVLRPAVLDSREACMRVMVREQAVQDAVGSNVKLICRQAWPSIAEGR